MGRKSKAGKGIVATSAFRKFHRYENIEDIAKYYGIYSFDELHTLIKKHSPIKDTDTFNLCYIIYISLKSSPKATFHSICVDNIDEFTMLIGKDPDKVFHGEAWFQNRKKKDKNIKRSDFPIKYTKVIDAIRLRWERLYVQKNKIFMGWYKEQTKGSLKQRAFILNRDLVNYIRNKKSK